MATLTSGSDAAVDIRRLVLRTLMPGFVGTSVPAWLDTAISDGLCSVCIYGPNVVDRNQLRELCTDLHRRSPDVILAVDEEGGDVTRLHYRTGSPHVGNAVLGRLDDVDVTRASAAEIAADLRDVGIDLDLAPVVDVNSSDDNPVIGVRSFGSDAHLAARHTTAWVEGLQSGGIAACAKHFPGHGDTTADSHHDLPVVAATAAVIRSRELVPFRAAVESGVACVMTAAVVVPSLDPDHPATFSSLLLQGVLRDELGFGGVIVTDALDMAGASAETGIPEAAVRALVAGCDLLCLGSETSEQLVIDIVSAVVTAVSDGRLPLHRLRSAASAVDRLASRRPGAPGTVSETTTLDDAWVAAAFTVTDRAREWLAAIGEVEIVQVDSASNLAVGHVPWGPASVGATTGADGVGEGARVAVVGRDLGRLHPVWAVADELRRQRHDVVVVECGWPRGGADIVTWGGSPVVSRALVALLRSAVVPG
jgi:beta-N-acetylhexosaminidase